MLQETADTYTFCSFEPWSLCYNLSLADLSGLIWSVGYLGFNESLQRHFSLYRANNGLEKEKESKQIPNNPPHLQEAHLGSCPTI